MKKINEKTQSCTFKITVICTIKENNFINRNTQTENSKKLRLNFSDDVAHREKYLKTAKKRFCPQKLL